MVRRGNEEDALTYSGLRPHEATRLQWADFNFTDNVIIVKSSKTKARQRAVPMHWLIRETLLQRRVTNRSGSKFN